DIAQANAVENPGCSPHERLRVQARQGAAVNKDKRLRVQARQGAAVNENKSQRPDRSPEVANAISEALNVARRPQVVTGLTFTRSNAGKNLLHFIERQNIPFVSTLHAKGFLPESHPNWTGVIGRARRTDVKAFTDQADLIIAIGYDPIEINYEEWA